MTPHAGVKPVLGRGVFVAPNAALVGNVKVGDRASIWYGSVIRGPPSLVSSPSVNIVLQEM